MSNNTHRFWDIKRIFHFPRLTTKTICTLGLLIAITVVLSYISGYLRIGVFSKLTISFVSVFIAAYAFGGVTGGIVAAVADIISCFVNPVGPFMPQLTVIELLYGFIYGMFFYKTKPKLYLPMLTLCNLIQLTVNLFIKTAILSITYNTAFSVFFISRLPMCIIQTVIIFILLILIEPFIKSIKK